MRPGDLEVLRASVDRRVEIRCHDGQVFVADLILVSDAHEDVIVDVVSANAPGHSVVDLAGSALQIRFCEISSVRPLGPESIATEGRSS